MKPIVQVERPGSCVKPTNGDIAEMKIHLEKWGIKVNNSMGKNLVKRLYEECSVYTKTGALPEYLLKEEEKPSK